MDKIKKTMDLAWAAGFFDGEGSITFVGKSVRIFLTQKEREPLDRFKSIVGYGIVYPRQHRQTAKGKDTYCYKYYVGGFNGRQVLEILYPYLFVKKIKAELAFDIYRNYKGKMCNRESGKHKRGRPITKHKSF